MMLKDQKPQGMQINFYHAANKSKSGKIPEEMGGAFDWQSD